ncbi:MAG: hypothetical protein ACD_61C00151G0001 [uncultured bacterium]|nr:MAG: hypothetical protein ACD_61C00151G0001 [uncultured bacterium]
MKQNSFFTLIAIFVLFLGANGVSDNIRQFRNQQITVRLTVEEGVNGTETQLARVNSFTSLGEGFELYLVSQQVEAGTTFISDRDPDKFFLVNIIGYGGTYMVGFGKTDTLYELVCAPAGYTTAQQVISYENEHYSPIAMPTLLLDGHDKEGKFTYRCQ